MREFVAHDFFTVPTVGFKILFVLIVLAHHQRRIVHFHVTEHPIAAWPLPQVREVLAVAHASHVVLPGRDRISSPKPDVAVMELGARVLYPPVQAPEANTVCARLLGTLRRESLDFLIPLSAEHLRRILWRGGSIIIGPPALAARVRPSGVTSRVAGVPDYGPPTPARRASTGGGPSSAGSTISTARKGSSRDMNATM
jgi:hypothetical protein